jgi:hypothetical protein
VVSQVIYSIIEFDIAKGFDLSDSDALTASIEGGTSMFIKDIEGVLKG